jgi:hypothetical protein
LHIQTFCQLLVALEIILKLERVYTMTPPKGAKVGETRFIAFLLWCGVVAIHYAAGCFTMILR